MRPGLLPPGPPGPALRLLLGCGLLGGCDGSQSVLNPHGPQAEAVAVLSWVLFGGAALIFLAVMAMVLAGMLFPGRFRAVGAGRLVGGGTAFTVAVLLVLTVAATLVGASVTRVGTGPGEEPLRIEVVGWMWWWEVRYPDTPWGTVVTANEIRIPVDRPVQLDLHAGDVIHSFWVPGLHGKRDMIPGRINRLRLSASKTGRLRGQCAEFCGEQHTLMAFEVEAMEPEAFAAWLENEARPARAPADPALAAGAAAFLEVGCGACHAVRGLHRGPYAAVGTLGPDLTHFAGRRTLAAATLPAGTGPLAAWIAGSQHIKPGNRMPSFDRLDGERLTAIVRYLESLE